MLLYARCRKHGLLWLRRDLLQQRQLPKTRGAFVEPWHVMITWSSHDLTCKRTTRVRGSKKTRRSQLRPLLRRSAHLPLRQVPSCLGQHHPEVSNVGSAAAAQRPLFETSKH